MNEEEKQQAIKEYMSQLGKLGGEKLKEKGGSDYFKWVRSHRKSSKGIKRSK